MKIEEALLTEYNGVALFKQVRDNGLRLGLKFSTSGTMIMGIIDDTNEHNFTVVYGDEELMEADIKSTCKVASIEYCVGSKDSLADIVYDIGGIYEQIKI